MRRATTAVREVDPSGAAGPQVLVLTEESLSGVWAAVDASTATATKTANRSDWARFTAWTTERGFAALPAPALVVAHYLTEAATEQTSVGRWRYTPATLSRWVSSINQFHTAAGLDAPGRTAASATRTRNGVPAGRGPCRGDRPGTAGSAGAAAERARARVEPARRRRTALPRSVRRGRPGVGVDRLLRPRPAPGASAPAAQLISGFPPGPCHARRCPSL